MAFERTLQAAAPSIERRRAVTPALQRSAAFDALSPGRALQQRLGNRATQSLIARAPQLQRRTIDGSAATVSWIDPASNLPISDPAPPATITEAFVTGQSGFRFTNYLHAALETTDSVHVAANRFQPNSGMYRGPSYLGVASLAYPTHQRKADVSEGGVDGVEFEQLTGARTISPAVIGGRVGAGVGVGVGIWGGAKIGAAIGAFGGPIGAIAGGVIGGLVGGALGWAAGRATANAFFNFPPIWTRIRLRLFANGRRQCTLAEKSHFPSNVFYCDLSRVSGYNGVPHLTTWQTSGWGGGNPWIVTGPIISL
jgi:hypothetical protein